MVRNAHKEEKLAGRIHIDIETCAWCVVGSANDEMTIFPLNNWFRRINNNKWVKQKNKPKNWMQWKQAKVIIACTILV